MLTTSSASVNEGSSVVFTLNTTNVDAGSVYSYVLSGVSASDVVGGALTGTATVGADGKAVVAVQLAADATTEGVENMTMTLAGQTASVSVADTSLTPPPPPPEPIALTTNLDNRTGTAGDDTFSGTVIGAGATGTTAQAGDVIDGSTGTDTFNLSIAGDAGGAYTVSALTVSGVEKVIVSNFDANAASTTIDTSLFSGVNTVGLSASSATGDTVFSNLAAVTTAELKNGSGDLTLDYLATAVVGSTDVQNIALQGVTAGTVTVNGVETMSLSNSLVASTLTAVVGDAATTINVNASAALDLGAALGATVKTVNASASTAGVTLIANTNTDLNITGGSGNDSITTATALAEGNTISGGSGTDTLTLTADTITTAAVGARYTGFERLGISQGAAATATRTQDLSLISGVNTAVVSRLADTADGNADNTQTVNFTNASANVNSLNISGLAITEDAHDLIGSVSLTRATDTNSDSMTVTLGTTTAGAGSDAIAAAAGAQKLLDITLANEETINVVSQGGANFIRTLSSADATRIDISGSKALSIGSITAANLATLNASGMTANLAMTANTSTVASTITGGSGNDSLIGGTKADNISGGNGNDTVQAGDGNDVVVGGAGDDNLQGQAGVDNLSGGDGDDTFAVSTATHFIGLTAAETVAGGAGNDTLAFAANTTYTITAADLTGLSSIEEITIDGDANAASITLNNAVYTSNGVANLAVTDADLAQGALTVNASALTGTNAVTVTANTTTAVDDSLVGGAGNDTFVFATTAGLEGTDTVNGGAGTDTIQVDSSAAATLVMTNVTNIERIVTDGNGTGTITIDVLDANITTAVDATDTTPAVAVGSMTLDATSLTNGTGKVDYDGSLVTTVTKRQYLTGSAGADTLTGGSGNDVITGGGGADTIRGGVGVDNLSGGDGDDVFQVTAAAELVSLASTETISGGSGNDTLRFAVGAADVAVAATDLAGINSIETIKVVNANGRTASVTLTDAVFSANGATSLNITNAALTADGGANTDDGITVNASALTSSNSISFTAASAAGANESVVGGAGNDTFTFNTFGVDGAAGGVDDVATAFDANDTVTGGSGNDTLVLATGSTALTAATLTNVAGIENITVTGTTGGVGLLTLADGNFATVTGARISATSLTTGALLVTAAAEDDSTFIITGGSGADSIVGGQLNDTISGGLGVDTIQGGLGADSLSGGAGADRFQYTLVTHSNTTRTDTITDFVSGTDKLDVTLNYSGLNAGVTVDATVQTAVAGTTAAQDALSGDRGQAIYDTTGSALFINVNADNLLTTADYKIAINPASTAANTIAEGDINFTITTGAGADSITAGGGADTITAGGGADTITAGGGADTITGGAGADVLTGGAGADTFVFATGDTGILVADADTVTDFVTASDVIDVFDAAVARGVTIANGAGNANLAAVIADADVAFNAGDGVYVEYNVSGGGNAYVLVDEDASGAFDAGDTLIILTGINLVGEIAVGDFA